MSDIKSIADYLRKYNSWRRGEDERTMVDAGIMPAEVGQMIDAAVELLEGHAQGYAEPVGEITTYPHVGVKFYENTDFGTALPEGTKLFVCPPKAQAVPEMMYLGGASRAGIAFEYREKYCQGWNDCRSSMIDAAPQPPQEGE